MNLSDNICICGHSRYVHTAYVIDPDNIDACAAYIDRLFCVCNKFKLDNLRYLEQLSDKR